MGLWVWESVDNINNTHRLTVILAPTAVLAKLDPRQIPHGHSFGGASIQLLLLAYYQFYYCRCYSYYIG